MSSTAKKFCWREYSSCGNDYYGAERKIYRQVNSLISFHLFICESEPAINPGNTPIEIIEPFNLSVHLKQRKYFGNFLPHKSFTCDQ